MLAFLLQAQAETPALGKWEYGGLLGALLVAVGVLWRAYTAKIAEVDALLKAATDNSGMLEKLAESVEMLCKKMDNCPQGSDRLEALLKMLDRFRGTAT